LYEWPDCAALDTRSAGAALAREAEPIENRKFCAQPARIAAGHGLPAVRGGPNQG
jgi:hypothetical protein